MRQIASRPFSWKVGVKLTEEPLNILYVGDVEVSRTPREPGGKERRKAISRSGEAIPRQFQAGSLEKVRHFPPATAGSQCEIRLLRASKLSKRNLKTI